MLGADSTMKFKSRLSKNATFSKPTLCGEEAFGAAQKAFSLLAFLPKKWKFTTTIPFLCVTAKMISLFWKRFALVCGYCYQCLCLSFKYKVKLNYPFDESILRLHCPLNWSMFFAKLKLGNDLLEMCLHFVCNFQTVTLGVTFILCLMALWVTISFRSTDPSIVEKGAQRSDNYFHILQTPGKLIFFT